MYKLIKSFLFLFDPELIHKFTILFIKFIPLKKVYIPDELRINLFGLNFLSPVGLAAGFDKNAEVYNKVIDLGFGFIEIGTVTPKPQFGNKKPRVFRLEKENGIINSLGFNNYGFKKVIKNLKVKKSGDIIGINIGANKNSDYFIDDYIEGIKFFSNCASYITINISSPNTPGLRDLNLENNLKKRLTKNVAIDTAPSYSPDGKFIVFESDRGGNQQIYVMPASGPFTLYSHPLKPTWMPHMSTDHLCICDVSNIPDFVAQVFEVSKYNIKGDKCSAITKMNIIVNSGSTNIHPHHLIMNGCELFFRTA